MIRSKQLIPSKSPKTYKTNNFKPTPELTFIQKSYFISNVLRIPLLWRSLLYKINLIQVSSLFAKLYLGTIKYLLFIKKSEFYFIIGFS